MPIKLFNTMSRAVEELQPLKPGHIGLYACGPTVYDYAQIGNWAAYIRWDTLVRMLRQSSYAVTHVMNITDVGHLTSDADEGEDKLEKGARREGKTAWEVAAFYTQDFLEGMRGLNLTAPTRLVKATDTIAEQIAFVKQLEAKDYIYRTSDGMYFDTGKLHDYGKLARLDVAGLHAGARVEFTDEKRHITDFAVWKFTPPGVIRDMEWDSPWGKGFPGWHLECSVMAMKYLGETLDIHAGGIDHIPVHHTNEIAQSEAVTGKPLANIWLHGSFITVDGVKVSKSLGNSFSLQDVVARGFEPLALRLLFLQSHYRTEANFTWEALAAAKNRLQDLRAMADLRWQPLAAGKFEASNFEQAQQSILEALQDDLNSPLALARLSGAEQQLQVHGVGRNQLPAFTTFLEFLDQTLGLQLLNSSDITTTQKATLAKRQAARIAKDFTTSDILRSQLARQNIGLRDTPHGQVWFRLYNATA